MISCKLARNKILKALTPDTLTDDVRDHLQHCEKCEAWFTGYLRLNSAIQQRRKPIVSESVKTTFLYRFLHLGLSADSPIVGTGVGTGVGTEVGLNDTQKIQGDAANKHPMLLQSSANLPGRKQESTSSSPSLLSRYWPLGLVAATILIGFMAVMQLSSQPGNPIAVLPEDPLLKRVVQLNLELSATKTPSERIDKLVGLSNTIYDEMKGIAKVDKGDQINKLSKWYQRIIQDGIVDSVSELNELEREKVLKPLLNQLEQRSLEAQQFAREVPPQSVKSFQNAARDAQSVSEKIRILKGGTS